MGSHEASGICELPAILMARLFSLSNESVIYEVFQRWRPDRCRSAVDRKKRFREAAPQCSRLAMSIETGFVYCAWCSDFVYNRVLEVMRLGAMNKYRYLNYVITTLRLLLLDRLARFVCKEFHLLVP